jgi:tetratricopeptide (TPR) repeat protein
VKLVICRILCAVVCSLSATLVAAQSFPPLSSSVSQCESRWALLEPQDTNQRSVAFVYVDPQLGFTLDHYGPAGLDAAGKLTLLPFELRDKARLITRVAADLPLTCLDAAAVTALNLPTRQEIIDIYRDSRPAGAHLEAWARHYNHIAAVQKGLQFTDEAIAAGHASEGLAFERGFALNVLARFDEAEQVLEPAVRRYPTHVELKGELAYTYVGKQDFRKAIRTYQQALEADRKGTAERRIEFARNIAASYSRLGDQKRAQEWVRRAMLWTSEREKRAQRN